MSGDWSNIPHTDRNASVSSYRKVNGKRVIKIEQGRYRNATLTGHFELEDQHRKNPIKKHRGEDRVNVVITWKTKKLKRDQPLLTVSNCKFEFIDNYIGPVAKNVQ